MNENMKVVTQSETSSSDIQLSDNIFSSWRGFQAAQKMAMSLSGGTIVPKDYQGNPGNCLIAIEMANRMGTSPMMVMQNLYIVNGHPAWSSQYIVAMINSSRKYKTELQYDLRGVGDDMSCYAWAEDHNGHKVVGPTITMKMAREEGWTSKNGSKWKTMPEVMIRYRAASFFGRLNCPDMIMGIYSTDEVIELREDQFTVVEEEIRSHANREQIDIQADVSDKQPSPNINPDTGEVLNPEDLPPVEEEKPQPKKRPF